MKEPGTGAGKNGSALLTGLLRCGRCGHKLFTRYGGAGGDVPRYVCRGERRNHPEPQCMAVGGLRIDDAVVQAVLEAIQAASIQAAFQVAEQFEAKDDEQLPAMRLALEKARYEGGRARRQYDNVDPENRLVAGELERRWNDAIEQAADVERRLEELDGRHMPLAEAEKLRLLELGGDLSNLWRHPATTADLKKRILRTVIHEIVIDVQDDPPRNRLRVHWKGGIHTELIVARNPRGKHSRATSAEAIDLIRELSKVHDDREIARLLNRLGYRTGRGNSWQASRVTDVRCHYRLPTYEKRSDWLTMQQAAKELRVSTTVIKRLLDECKLPAKQVIKHAPWIIERTDLARPQVQAEIAAVHSGTRRPLTHADQGVLPLE